MNLQEEVSAARNVWEKFWFPSEPVQALAACRILLFGGILLDFFFADFTFYAEAARHFWVPTSFYARLSPQGPLDEPWLAAFQAIWKFSLFTAALGLFTRLSTWTACLLGIYLVGLPYNFGKLDHHMGAAMMGTLILAFSACGKIWSVDVWLARRRGKSYPSITEADAGWPIQLMRVVICLVFFGAGFNKVSTSGLTWVTSDSMHMNLILLHSWLGRPLIQWPWLCHLMAGFALLVEFCHPLALFSKRLALFFVPAGFSLIFGICMVLDISFLMFAYVQFFWLPWGRIFRQRPA